MRSIQKPKKNWSAFEHRCYQKIKKIAFNQDTPLFILVSAGKDSMVLWRLLRNFSSIFGYPYQVVHFNHGRFANKKFRDQSEKLVEKEAQLANETLLVFRARKKLKSENEMRNFRLTHVEQLKKNFPKALFLTGHHLQDQLETRFQRMIRGTGLQGVGGMKRIDPPFFRLFLDEDQKEISVFAKKNKVKFIDDPSNKKTQYLRNWLRNKLFPALEKKNPGSLRNINAFYEKVVMKESEVPKVDLLGDELVLNQLILQTDEIQKTILFQFLKKHHNHNFLREINEVHVKELQKRIQSSKNDQLFSLAGLEMSINAKRLRVHKSSF